MTLELLEILSEGERKTRGQADQVARSVRANPQAFPDLVDAMVVGTATVRAHGAAALRTIFERDGGVILAHKSLILARLVPIDQWEVRSELCHILPELPLTKAERQTLFATIKTWRHDKSKIVQAWSISALFHLSQADEALADEMAQILSEVDVSAPPSVKARVRRLLRGQK